MQSKERKISILSKRRGGVAEDSGTDREPRARDTFMMGRGTQEKTKRENKEASGQTTTESEVQIIQKPIVSL